MKKKNLNNLQKIASISLSFMIMLQLFTSGLNVVFANDEGIQVELEQVEQTLVEVPAETTANQPVTVQAIKAGFALGETVDIIINGVANQTVATVNLGDITPINFDGYTFIKATVGGVAINGLGKHDGELYYSIMHADSAFLVGSNSVEFNYEKNLSSLNVNYSFDATVFSVEGNTSITEGQSLFFKINQLSNSHKLSSVKANGNLLTKNQDGYYVVANVTSDMTIDVVAEVITNFDITVDTRYANGYAFGVNSTITKADSNWTEIGVINTHVDTFNSIVVNGQYINIATANASQSITKETTLADGTQIKVHNKSTYDAWLVAHVYTYTIYVKNASSDLHFVPSMYKSKNISFLSIEGVDVYHWTGSELSLVPVGAMLNKQNETDVFFVATKPGYAATLSVDGAGTKIIEDIHNVGDVANVTGSYATAKKAALEKGSNYVFYYSDKSVNNRQVSIEAVMLDYSVNYDLNGGQSTVAIEDKNIYSVENGNNILKLNSNLPEKDNATFIGWKIDGSNITYSANKDVVLNKQLIKLTINNSVNFVAQWIEDKNQITADYVIKHLFQQEDGNYVEDQSMRAMIQDAPVNEKALAIPKKNLDNHLFDATLAQNKLSGLVSVDNKLELNVYYSLKPVTPTPIPPVATPEPTPIPPVVEVVVPAVTPTITPVVTPVVTPTVTPDVNEEVVEENLTPEQGAQDDVAVDEDETPLVGAGSHWALINLLLAAAALLLAVFMVLKRTDENGKSNKIYKMFSVLIAMTSVIVFILTQSLGGTMVIADSWSMLMGALVAVQGAITMLTIEIKDKTNKLAN